MTTDTSERGLERLICTALTGSPCDPGTTGVVEVEERPPTYGVGWIGGTPEDYDREYCVDLAQLSAFLHETQPEVAEHLELGQDGPTRRKVSRTIARRDQQARHDRRAAPRHQARAASSRSVLRHAIAGQRKGEGALCGEPLQRHAPVALQPRRDAARPRPGPVHQWPADRDLRAEEQSHQADGRRRRSSSTSATAIRARSCSSSAAASCISRWTTRGALLHAAARARLRGFCRSIKGWNDGAGNPPNPNGLKTDYLWKRILTPRRPDGHPRELRADRRGQGPEDRQEKADADLPALSPARRGAEAPGCTSRPNGAGKRYLDPALGGQRQIEFDRVAGASTRSASSGTTRRCSIRSSS